MNPFKQLAEAWGFHERTVPLSISINDYQRERGVQPPTLEKELESAAEAVGYVYACVSAVATKVAEVPWTVYDNQAREVSHPILDLLRDPNPHYTEMLFKEAIASHLLLAGNSFVEKIFDGRGQLRELWPIIPPSAVWVIPGKTKFVAGYLYKPPTGRTEEAISLPKEKVMHFKYFHARNSYYGLSPLQAIYTQLLGDISAVQYNKNFFDQGARPGGILRVPHFLPDSVIKDMADKWHEVHGGVGKAHKIAILTGGAEYQPISLSQEEMQFLESRRFTREEITAVYRVPPTELGLTTGTSYSEASQAREQFYLDVIIPLSIHIAQVIQKELFPEQDRKKGYILWPDFTQVQALTAITERRARTAERLLRVGWPPNLIAMRLFGLPPFLGDEGWVGHVPANLVPLGMANKAVLGENPQKLGFEPVERTPESVQQLLEKLWNIPRQVVVHETVEEIEEDESAALPDV
jgi:HK97 family phage portal protein